MSILSSPERAHSPQSEHRGAATVLADDGTGGGTARAGPHTRAAPAAPLVPQARPVVAGKFLFAGGEKLYVRGVTYGPFGADGSDAEYGDAAKAARDFARIAAAGFNTLRVYSVPPAWLLDAAAERGLRVMVGLPWEQHVAFLDDATRARDIERRVAEGVDACARHPAVLAYAIGNEIPAPVVRWYGHRRVERYLRRLYDAAKAADPGALVTYVNYPSTEYLDLPFLDFASFNLYLESPSDLEAYVARLHNIAGDRPLVMAEVGLDALRHGDEAQAVSLAAQVRGVMRGGCAGAFVFAWTDEWHRGGMDITDWRFGLTTRDRAPRPALAAVARVFAEAPAAPDRAAPGVSVVVCTHNGSRTIAGCLEGLRDLAYPDYEVIVVDDGSTDGTADVVRRFEFARLIRTENRGLSSARNTGLQAARLGIIAYIDDDARPDPHWLTYLVDTLTRADHAGAGGPNVPPAGCGLVSDAVAMAPGGPVHVLLTDQVAEHIPGCNMAFRRDRLLEIGGFDPQFRIAGDDVDVCWRLQERGWTLGFNPAAVVWHRRRDTVRGYWKQQLNYGRAEADLERKWPEKYNAAGHLTWNGRLYGNGLLHAMGWWARRRIYHGTWGSALFQSVYHVRPNWLWSLPAMPEWYILVALLAAVAAVGPAWKPMLAVLPFLALAAAAPVVQAAVASRRAINCRPEERGWRRSRLLLLTLLLHLIQPAARLGGRVCRGLTPLRTRGIGRPVLPLPAIVKAWTESWISPESRLGDLLTKLRAGGAVVLSGGDFDRWDCEVRGGVLGAARVRLLVEEHGSGRQLARFRVWPHCPPRAMLPAAMLAAVAAVAAADGARAAAVLFAAAAAVVVARAAYECAAATGAVVSALVPARGAQRIDPRAAGDPAANPDADPELELAGGLSEH
jgi:GT2 family glycosyltransferase